MSVSTWNTPEERARRAEQSARRAQQEAEMAQRVARENEARARRREEALAEEYARKKNELERRMAQQQAQHSSEVAAMGEQVRQMIRQQNEAHAKEMRAQREQMGLELGRVKSEQNALRTEIKDSERRTAEQLKVLSQSVDQRIAKTQNAMDKRMNELSRSIDARFSSLEKGQKDRKKQAEELLAELEQAKNAVQAIDPDGFYLREAGFSDEYADIENRLALARGSFSSGAYEAAIAGFQSALVRLWKADGIAALTRRELLERADLLSHQAETLKKRFDENRSYAITYELDDETVTEECDLDQWTMGAWGRTENQLNDLCALLKKEQIHASELDEAERTLARMAGDLPVLEEKARALLIRSRVTEDVANRIHYVLTEMGHWQCETGDHADGNETAPVELRYVDDSGNLLEFVVSGGESNENVRMFLRAKSADGSESHGLSLRQSASDLLEQQGLEMEDVHASRSCGEEDDAAAQDEIVKAHAQTARWMKEGLRA